jgi:hypothetical protein
MVKPESPRATSTRREASAAKNDVDSTAFASTDFGRRLITVCPRETFGRIAQKDAFEEGASDVGYSQETVH